MTNDDKKIQVERVIDQPADVLFEILSNPKRHPEIDGSGMVRADEKTDRIQQVGQVFTMNMHNEALGDYQTDNVVTGYEHNKLLAWKTGVTGTEPGGWQWVWELEPEGPGSTVVRHTYDWSGVTDKGVLNQIPFPFVPQDALQESLSRLAATAGS